MNSLHCLFAMLLIVPPAIAEERVNIVFILADDLGINDLSCYGRKDQQTPHFDQLAKQGVRFTSAYCAQPICSPTRAAIMTGKSPARLNLTTYLPGRADCPSQMVLHPQIQQQLPLRDKTLAEYLKTAGYSTACIGKWHLGAGQFAPENRGFDVVYSGKANTPPSETEGGKGEYDLTAKAEDFLEKNQSRPFFLYLAHNSPHIPLAAKPELINKYRDSFNPTYAAVIATLDDCIGKILKKLDALKLTEKTIVIFTSDNGGLHVLEYPLTPATHNTPYRAGKGFLYEGGLRIPLIVRWPGRTKADQVIHTPVISTDWLPTLLELTRNRSKPQDLDGMSMVNVLKQEDSSARKFFWHFPHYNNQGGRPGGAIRDGDWKYIEYYDDGSRELYNLREDISETTNIEKDHPDRVNQAADALKTWRKSVKAQENVANPAFNPELFRKLYRDVDVSKLVAEKTAEQMAVRLKAWRETMDSVLPKSPKK